MHKLVIFTWNLQLFSQEKSKDYAEVVVDHIVASVGLNVEPNVPFVGTLLEIRAPKEKELSSQGHIRPSQIDEILKALKSKVKQKYKNIIDFQKKHVGGGQHTSEWIIVVFGNIGVPSVELLSATKFLNYEISATSTAAIGKKRANVTSRSSKEFGGLDKPERPREESVAPFGEYLDQFNQELSSLGEIKLEHIAATRETCWSKTRKNIPDEMIAEIDVAAEKLTNRPYAPWNDYFIPSW